MDYENGINSLSQKGLSNQGLVMDDENPGNFEKPTAAMPEHTASNGKLGSIEDLKNVG